MPFSTPSNAPIPQGALIVCAGTITVSNVEGMGSGFMVFKKQFNQNIAFNDGAEGWKGQLQNILDKYFKGTAKMPAYIRVAKQDGYIGGIATVPAVNYKKGLNPSPSAYEGEYWRDFEKEYKSAVTGALESAKELNRTLYIQPLGIGVYGWSPIRAAQLFAEAIMEIDSEDQMDVVIPIFNTQSNSNDMQFKNTLIEEMARFGRHPKSDTVNIPQQQKPVLKEEITKHEHPLQSDVVREVPQQQKPTLKVENRQILADIISTVVNKIEKKVEDKTTTRKTSGTNSEKVKLLKQLENQIRRGPEFENGSDEQKAYVNQAINLCRIKRHLIHFWKTPESVNEFKQLLTNNNIALPEENTPKLNLSNRKSTS